MVITGVILAGAGVWAGRRVWRAAKPRPEADGQAPGCGGGCGGCPVSEARAAQASGTCSAPERKEH